MLKRDKLLFLGTLIAISAWVGIYYFMIDPSWSSRQKELTTAQGHLERWLKFYKTESGKLPLPAASKELDKEKQLLVTALGELKQIEFASRLNDFAITAAGGEDPNNYFDKKRREVSDSAKARYGVTFAPGLDDLGFHGEITKDSKGVPLNLVRLFALRQFFVAAKEAAVTSITSIRYPKELALELAVEGGQKVPRLFQVPLEIRLRVPERNFAQLLYEVQRPSDNARSYFCLRGFQVSVKDAASGMVDATLALGALFPEAQFLTELKIPFKDDGKTEGPTKPILAPDRY